MKRLALFLFILSAFGCKVEPKPIVYGTDGCHFCRMTIVDAQHAAQAVTAKGRVYSFDAIECLVHYLQDNNDTEMAHMLVADYTKPGELTNARQAVYLVSPGIPSPMGANLSAVADMETAELLQREKGGTLYTWDTIQKHLQHPLQ